MIAFGCPASRPAGVGKVWIRGSLCYRAASFTYFGEVLRCRSVHINASCTLTIVYIARNNIHYVRGNNTIPYKLASLVTFESLK